MPKKQVYILIAEDDKVYGKIFERKLKSEGFETEWVGDGEQALAKIKERKPDLLILDIMMPKKDGIEVLQGINEMGLGDHIKILVATNLSQDIDVAKAKDLGADDYFVKSDISVKEMVEKVKSHLG